MQNNKKLKSERSNKMDHKPEKKKQKMFFSCRTDFYVRQQLQQQKIISAKIRKKKNYKDLSTTKIQSFKLNLFFFLFHFVIFLSNDNGDDDYDDGGGGHHHASGIVDDNLRSHCT